MRFSLYALEKQVKLKRKKERVNACPWPANDDDIKRNGQPDRCVRAK